ncbi:nucleotide-binding protein [Deltaproteobacteria bacterium]|nr:nucleotide-binding protein [Deltaproteobacteria bacterium]
MRLTMVKTCHGRLLVVTGLSGSGKSTVLKALEDLSYLTIDNLPVALLPKCLALRKESGGFIRLAVGMDAREPELAREFEAVFKEVRDLGYELSLLFIDASEETLVKRFSETRRPHHLAPRGDLVSAIRAEREHLLPLLAAADEVVDTSTLKAAALRELVMDRFSQDGAGRPMAVEILSFGFKNGLPPEADLMVDVRFLPNPFYLDDLRSLTGRDQPVIDYVLNAPETGGFLARFTDLLAYLLPFYQREGKSYLTIAVGCTGGQHRSVAVAGALGAALRDIFSGPLNLRHRDIS